MIRVFPYAIVRIGGDSFDQLECLTSNDLANEISHIVAQKKEIKQRKEILCDHLLEEIKVAEPRTQNTIQNLRRDIFNDRKLKNNKVNRVLEVVSEKLKGELHDYLISLNNFFQKEIEFEKIHGNNLFKSRVLFSEMVQGNEFKNGLILSSNVLFERIDKYVSVTRKGGQDTHTEIGLIKYMTRMCAKTSPFSTLTNISMATLQQKSKSAFINTDRKPEDCDGPQSVVRINNGVFKYVQELLKNYRPAFRKLKVVVNPTVRKQEKNYVFLINSNNVESFQQIGLEPVVELITDIVSSARDGIVFHQLTELLLEQISSTEAEIENYIEALISAGYLEFVIDASGIDPEWDKTFLRMLDLQLEEIPGIDQLKSSLINIRKLANDYARASTSERRRIQTKSFSLLRQASENILDLAGIQEPEMTVASRENEKPIDKRPVDDNSEVEKEMTFVHRSYIRFPFKPEHIFYEDTVRHVNVGIDKDELTCVLESLNEVLASLTMFDGALDERNKMREFYKTEFSDQSRVDLLQFYESYFRYQKKVREELDKQPDAEQSNKIDAKNPSDADFFESVREHRKNINGWFDSFVKTLEMANEISNQRKFFSNLDWSPLVGKKLSNTSLGAFLQLFEEEGKLKAVVNGTFPGFGKMFGRFLHLFNNEYTTSIIHWNSELCSESEMFIENCDASFFNANIHPTLLPLEVSTPNGQNSLPHDKRIPVTEFSVRWDQQLDELILEHKPSGKRAFVFDLGFQGAMGRSPLFRLLEKFSKSFYIQCQPILKAVNRATVTRSKDNEGGVGGVTELPRIVFKDRVILQRKTWLIKKESIPVRRPNQSDASYYLVVNIWRRERDIPRHAFVFVKPNRFSETKTEKTSKMTRDDYKPQYIDFECPLMMGLLEKMIQKVSEVMKIEEMLPEPTGLMTIDSKKYVSEIVAQWYID